MNPLTGPVPSDWPKILGALPKDKYLATVVLIVVLASYFISSKDKTPVRFSALLLVVAAAILLILGPEFLRTKNSPDVITDGQYVIHVEYAGTRHTVSTSATPFRISSGQVNFGCAQVVPLTVRWTVPATATVTDYTASWDSVANATTSPANAAVSGPDITASGTLTGIPFQEFPFGIRNCPGGGHGELVLTGKYTNRQDVSEALHGQLPIGQLTRVQRPVVFALPVDDGVQIASVNVVLNRTDASEAADAIHFDLNKNTTFPFKQNSGSGRFTATIDEMLRLVVDIKPQ